MTRSERSLRTPRALSLLLSNFGPSFVLLAAFILAIVLAVVLKSWPWLLGVPVVVLVFLWYLRSRSQKMYAFFIRAVETYAQEENPTALHYILVCYATAGDSDKRKILSLLAVTLRSPDQAINQRIRRVLDIIGSREWTLWDSGELKSALDFECLEAWVRFDLSIFERLEGLPSSIPPRYLAPQGPTSAPPEAAPTESLDSAIDRQTSHRIVTEWLKRSQEVSDARSRLGIQVDEDRAEVLALSNEQLVYWVNLGVAALRRTGRDADPGRWEAEVLAEHDRGLRRGETRPNLGWLYLAILGKLGPQSR